MTNKFLRAGGYALLIPPGIACAYANIAVGAIITSGARETNIKIIEDIEPVLVPVLIVMTYVVSAGIALAAPVMLVYTLVN